VKAATISDLLSNSMVKHYREFLSSILLIMELIHRLLMVVSLEPKLVDHFCTALSEQY
jgi:hypothetical protein